MQLHINLPAKDQPGWWDDWQSQDGPSYEQQLKDGFLPVYQGGGRPEWQMPCCASLRPQVAS